MQTQLNCQLQLSWRVKDEKKDIPHPHWEIRKDEVNRMVEFTMTGSKLPGLDHFDQKEYFTK